MYKPCIADWQFEYKEGHPIDLLGACSIFERITRLMEEHKLICDTGILVSTREVKK